MNDILFSEFSAAIWGLWGIIAALMGYLIASTLRDPEETTITVGAVALGFGVWEALWGGSFFRGVGETIKSLLMAVILVPAWPVLYLAEPGWDIGKHLNFGWLGRIGTSMGACLVGGMALMIMWFLIVSAARRRFPDIVASIMALPIFGIPPLIALSLTSFR